MWRGEGNLWDDKRDFVLQRNLFNQSHFIDQTTIILSNLAVMYAKWALKVHSKYMAGYVYIGELRQKRFASPYVFTCTCTYHFLTMGFFNLLFFEARHPIINYQLGRKLYVVSGTGGPVRSTRKAIGILCLSPNIHNGKRNTYCIFILYCTVLYSPVTPVPYTSRILLSKWAA